MSPMDQLQTDLDSWIKAHDEMEKQIELIKQHDKPLAAIIEGFIKEPKAEVFMSQIEDYTN